MKKMTREDIIASVQPKGYRLLVEIDKCEDMTSGGIYLARQTRENNQRQSVIGTVISVGEECWENSASSWAVPGDRVIIAKYGGLFLQDIMPTNENDLRILNDEDIIAVINIEEETEDV